MALGHFRKRRRWNPIRIDVRAEREHIDGGARGNVRAVYEAEPYVYRHVRNARHLERAFERLERVHRDYSERRIRKLAHELVRDAQGPERAPFAGRRVFREVTLDIEAHVDVAGHIERDVAARHRLSRDRKSVVEGKR